jgi:hypothetical protein
MLGLGDEYVEETTTLSPAAEGGFTYNTTRRFEGDRPDEEVDVSGVIDQAAEDELIVHNSDSIMASGNRVLAGHYAPIIQALERTTGANWTVER